MSGKISQTLAILVGILIVQIGLTLLGDGLYFTSHEADMVHLADLVLRQSAGEVFHQDIATPIGGWATLPMALLHRAGLGLGQAMVWGQVLVLAIFLPCLALVLPARFTLGQSAVVAIAVAGLTTGLAFGGTDPIISLSMSYNRWCWAAALIVTLVVLLPGTRPNSAVEGVVIGLLMAAMAMVKVSYPVALALPVTLGLLRNGRIRPFLAACLAAFAVLALITLFIGIDGWRAYVADLLMVAGSEHRAAPGADWPVLVVSPAGLPATLVVLTMIYLSGRLDRRDLGATLMLFFAAFTFITWQNFGNDPIWLMALAMVAWVLSRQAQGSAARAMRVLAVAAGVLILPVMLNILWSPMRHIATSEDLARPLLASDPSLRLLRARTETVLVTETQVAAPDATPTTFRGEVLPDCTLAGGFVGALERDSADLIALAPGIDRQPLVADLFQAHWLFAGLRPLKGAGPWYYDGLPGLADATYVLVPDCPSDRRGRARITSLLDEAEVPLEDAGRTENFRLYRIIGQE